jgi:hypothetical protein
MDRFRFRLLVRYAHRNRFYWKKLLTCGHFAGVFSTLVPTSLPDWCEKCGCYRNSVGFYCYLASYEGTPYLHDEIWMRTHSKYEP